MRRRIGLWILLCLFFVLAAGQTRAGEVPEALTTFAAAKVVIGQKNLTSGECDQGADNPTAKSLCGPEGGAAAGKKAFYIPDSENVRVLGFKKIPKKNGAAAKFVLGQSNFSNTNNGVSSTSFGFPGKVEVAGSQLFMVDFDNSRVLIWNKLPDQDEHAGRLGGWPTRPHFERVRDDPVGIGSSRGWVACGGWEPFRFRPQQQSDHD